jgi:DNA-directed RNA polymerase
MPAITGGYLLHKRGLLRSAPHSHTTALERPVSQLDLDAVNAAQATPWRINRWILDVMLEAWASGQRGPRFLSIIIPSLHGII